MRTDELDYDFDPALIATTAASPRDSARMLVYDRGRDAIEHRHVRDFDSYLGSGDLLVVNETAVAPARIKAVRSGGAHIEGLLLERKGPREWVALLKNARRVHVGERLALVGPRSSTPSGCDIVVGQREGDGWRVVVEGSTSAEAVLDLVGWTPLPPYILGARRAAGDIDDGHEEPRDRASYQTVYARADEAPSVAAPTAGLHLTPELLARIEALGVARAAVALQVGAGTFKPVETETLDAHVMHREHCVVPSATLAALARAKRVVAVGTTTVRTLESLPTPLPTSGPLVFDTDILIAPGHRFAHVDAMLTNFHLPRSTLIALVAAFVGLAKLKELYAVAQRERYRFYSFGDAMLVV